MRKPSNQRKSSLRILTLEDRTTPAIITVTSLSDNTNPGGGVTLREAILAAETDASVDGSTAGSGADIIRFDPALFSSGDAIANISLTGNTTAGASAFGITTKIDIEGPAGNSGLTLQGGGAASNNRFAYVSPTGDLTLKNLNVSGFRHKGGDGGGGNGGGGSGGGAAGLGGAVFNEGSLAVVSSTLSGNVAQGGKGDRGQSTGTFGGGGGGLLTNGNDDGNGGGPNGGIPNGGAGAFGGGGGGGKVDDAAGGNGGFGGGGGAGAYFYGSGGNGGFGGGGGGGAEKGSAGTGGFGGGDGRSANSGSDIAPGGGGAGMGGAIFNHGGTVTVTNSTLAGNTAAGGTGANSGSGLGGAVFNLDGSVTLVNATIAGNTADQGGGAVYNRNEAAPGSATLTLDNSILADSPGGVSDAVNDGGIVAGSQSNIVETNAMGGLAIPTAQIIANNGDPQLGPLADNGGPTLTHAPAAITSPILDAGSNAAAVGLLTDQRGFPFARVLDAPDAGTTATVDIGAVEFRFLPTFAMVVTTTDDELDDDLTNPNDLSLREAVFIANSRPGADVITFAAGLFTGGDSVITLTQFDTGVDTDEFGPSALRISSDVTIRGPGGDNGLTIRRDSTDTNAFRLFYVYNATTPASAALRLENLTLSGGLARGFTGGGGSAGMGGAVFNRLGAVTLTGVTLSANQAQGGNGFAETFGGGGVGANGSGGTGGGPNGNTFAGNGGFGGGGGQNAGGGFGGGGGGSNGGDGGFGGGGGSGGGGGDGGFGGGGGGFSSGIGGGAGMGGALFNYQGSVALTNSTLSGNSASGGNASFFAVGRGSGYGGAVFNYNGALTSLNATFSDNTVSAGTGLGSGGLADGGGIFSIGDGNSPDGNVAATVTLNNTILANTTGGTDFFRQAINGGTSTASVGSNNLIESNGPSGNDYTGGIASSDDPQLGVLADNGGPTFTHAPATTSPVLDAGSNAAAAALLYDQRGFPFTRVVDGPDADSTATVDVGAFEFRIIPTFDLVVTTTDDEQDGDLTDPGDLSLREAVYIANVRPGADTITFDSSLAGQTVMLSEIGSFAFGPTALAISSDVTLQGLTGNSGITISQNATDGMRIFGIFSRASLTIEYLTITGGLAQGGTGGTGISTTYAIGGGGGGAGMGGAAFIAQGGTLNLTQSTVTGNVAQGGAGGAAANIGSGNISGGGGASAAYNGGDVTGTPFGSNVGGGGGGLAGPGGSPAVVAPRTGGVGGQNEVGVQAAGGTLAAGGAIGTLGGGGGGSGGNTAGGGNGLDVSSGGFGGGGGGGAYQGGGLQHGPGGAGGFGAGGGGAAGFVSSGLVTTGVAGAGGFGGGGGGVGTSATYGATPGDGAAAGGFGGGAGVSGGGGGAGLGGAIFNNGGTLNITNSTLTGNQAIGGAGGADGGGTAGNAGQGLGGAVFSRNGSVTIINSTISDDTAAAGGRGLFLLGDGAGRTADALINNSILGQADNAVTDFATATTNGGNAPTSSGTNNLIRSQTAFQGTASAADPLLAALADNGGPTSTMALNAGSPAFNAGDDGLVGGLGNDQRGDGFDRIRGDAVDIGAFEVQYSTAGTVKLSLSKAGALTLTGDAADNGVTIQRNAAGGTTVTGLGTTNFNLNGVVQTAFTFAPTVKSIVANLGDGDDVLLIDAATDFQLPGGATFNLGAGDNTLNLVTSSLLSVGGPLRVTAGTGFDTVAINGAVGSSLAGGASLALGAGGSLVTIDTVAIKGKGGLAATAGTGNDEVSLHGVAVDQGGVMVNGGVGETTVYLCVDANSVPTTVFGVVTAIGSEEAYVNLEEARVGGLVVNAGRTGEAEVNVYGAGPSSVTGSATLTGKHAGVFLDEDFTIGGALSVTGSASAELFANAVGLSVSGAVSVRGDTADLGVLGLGAGLSAKSVSVMGMTQAKAELTDAIVSTAGAFGIAATKAAELTVSGGSVTVGGNLTVSAGTAADVDIAPPGVGAARVKGSMTVTGGTDGDEVTATSGMQVDRNLTLNLKGGDNQIELGTAGQPFNVGGALTITSTNGTDTAVLTGVKVVKNTQIKLGAGEDAVTIVDGSQFSGTTLIDLGGGQDTLSIANDLGATFGVSFTGLATFNLGADDDTATLGLAPGGGPQTTVTFAVVKNVLNLGGGMNTFDENDALVAGVLGAALKVIDNGIVSFLP